MNSKEELYKIANQILDYSIERTGTHPTAQIREEEIQWLLRTNSFRQILKDLEVLEILKKYLFIVEPDNIEDYKEFDTVDYLRLQDFMKKEEYQKIKEWLEEKQNEL